MLPHRRFGAPAHGYTGPVKRIDVDKARKLIDGGAQLIDVLPEPVFDQEHLPGATNRPLQTMDRDAVSDLDQDRALVVYCFDQH